MILKEFIQLYDGGTGYISIYENVGCKSHYYCEEAGYANGEEIFSESWFLPIAKRKVKRFCVIGGGAYKAELSIELEREG